jgi:hypothetical protein
MAKAKGKAVNEVNRQAAFAEKAADKAYNQAWHRAWHEYGRMHSITDEDQQFLKSMNIVWEASQ